MKGFFDREQELIHFAEVERLSALMIEQMKRNQFDAGWRCSLEVKKILLLLRENEKVKKRHHKKLRMEVRNKDYAKVYSEYVAKINALK